MNWRQRFIKFARWFCMDERIGKTASVSDSPELTGYVVEWFWADNKPENDKVVLIHIDDLAEFGVVAAWWCAEDYKWIALDDLVQFDEEKVDWWCDLINLPTPHNDKAHRTCR